MTEGCPRVIQQRCVTLVSKAWSAIIAKLTGFRMCSCYPGFSLALAARFSHQHHRHPSYHLELACPQVAFALLRNLLAHRIHFDLRSLQSFLCQSQTVLKAEGLGLGFRIRLLVMVWRHCLVARQMGLALKGGCCG